jgi:hypothetical protein
VTVERPPDKLRTAVECTDDIGTDEIGKSFFGLLVAWSKMIC